MDGTGVVEPLPADAIGVRDRLVGAAAALRGVDGRHLVRVRSVVEEPPAVVRERVPGSALTGQQLAADRAVAVVADVLDALAALHELGLAHGALGPGDVLLDDSVPLRPITRLTGWGVAAVVTGRAPDPAEDVRAAGRLLADLVPEPSPELSGVLASLLADDPTARPTAAAARDALHRVGGSRGSGDHRRSRPRRVGLATAAAAVLLAGLAGGRWLAAGEQPRAAAQPPAPAGPYVFPAIQRPDGLLVERTWVLEQDGAVLRGRTVVRNPTLVTASAGVDEVVPKSVADDVDDLSFRPGPDAIVERDPVVRFHVVALAPGASTSWELVVRLPRRAAQEDLPRLAADAESARAEYEQRLRQAREAAAPAEPTARRTS